MFTLQMFTGRYGGQSTWLLGVLLGLVFTVSLNAQHLLLFGRGELTIAHLGVGVTSADEAHYFSLIKRVSEGNVHLGNAVFKEHRDDPSLSSYGPLVQGMLLRVFHLRLSSAIFFGDLLFPFLAALLLFVTFRKMELPAIEAAAVTIVLLSAVGWSRSVNPQISVLLFLSGVSLFLLTRSVSSRVFSLLQGLIISGLIFVQVLYGEILLVAEACALFSVLFSSLKAGRHQALIRAAIVCLFSLVAFGSKLLLTLGTDSVLLSDTYRRLGMIPSHLPSAPLLQMQILLTIALLCLWSRKQSTKQKATFRNLSFLLLAGLFCLNQSLLLGFDLVFGLYFTLPLVLILRWSWTLLILSCNLLPTILRRLTVIVMALLSSWSMVSVSAEPVSPVIKDDALLLSWLDQEPKGQVILAPIVLSNLIPLSLSHFVVFNQYAHFQTATDSELADRFLLERSLFPIVGEEHDPLFSWVFGLYAGNLDARHRSLCALRSRLSVRDCRTDARSFIFHQDILYRLEENHPDRKKLLKQFHVDLILSEQSLPVDVSTMCPQIQKIGKFSVYRCGE